MQILINVRDKCNNKNPLLDKDCLKRGDVICYVPDDHKWGLAELSNPKWRIIRSPLLTEDACNSMLVPEPNRDPYEPNPMLQRRCFSFDIDSMTGSLKEYMLDDYRSIPVYYTEEDLLSFKLEKPTRTMELTL